MVEHNWNAGSTTQYVRTRRQPSACGLGANRRFFRVRVTIFRYTKFLIRTYTTAATVGHMTAKFCWALLFLEMRDGV